MPASIPLKAALAAVVAATMALPAVAAPPADDAAVRAATQSIYAPYVEDKVGPGPKLTASFAAAWRHALGSDGAMDYDPYCECQDFGEFQVVVRSIAISGDTARVAVTLSNFGTTTVKRLVFLKVAGIWLLDDMNDGDTPSLKRAMASGPAGAYAMGE